MATGLSTQLTRQIGEHLVTAELGRRGVIATPFSGNVPDIDLLAYANDITASIQVKAINKDSWQFDIRNFLEVTKNDKGQKVKGLNISLDRKLLCIFVVVGDRLGDDEFYLFRMGWLQDYFYTHYKGRKPPKNINSYHCAIWKKDLNKHQGKWGLIERKFKLKNL